jgi:hypothetical protein
MVARKQEFTCDQMLLLRASNREPREPFEIARSSREDLAANIIPIRTQRMSKLEPKVNIGARTALRVLAAQRPDKPTYEQGGRTKTRDLMPGGLPVNDHMVAALDHTIGWGSLRPVLERFQKTRCPTVNRLNTHAVLEVVLGKSSEEQYIQGADWVDTKQRAGAEQYGCMMAACYTRSPWKSSGRPTSATGRVFSMTWRLLMNVCIYTRTLEASPGCRCLSCLYIRLI